MSGWFPVNVGLRQGCMMSPWLFTVYMDSVIREVNVRVFGKGLELLSANGGRFEIYPLLFADDTALVSESEEKLCRLLNEFGRVCEGRKFRVNVVKNKVMRCSSYGDGGQTQQTHDSWAEIARYRFLSVVTTYGFIQPIEYCSNHVLPDKRFLSMKFGCTKYHGNIMVHLNFKLCVTIRIIV